MRSIVFSLILSILPVAAAKQALLSPHSTSSGKITPVETFLNTNVDDMITQMTLKQKVGQLFIFGFTGKNINVSLKRQLNTLYPGSIIVFGRNISSLKQIRRLNTEAQELAMKNTKVPLLISVDQEGGMVLRIKTSPALPSARTLALTGDEHLVQEAGYVTGQLLSTLGFNMNLAPVVDISDEQQRDFLENRAFGHQKEVVNQMSSAFSKGLVHAGILPTAKHFPGHGGVRTDSHLATPYKQITLTELLFNDLAPYKSMLSSQIPFAVMASHISYPLIDPSRKPATFSKVLLEKVLRKDLGYDGIVLTDDIQMKGARVNQLSLGERAVQAILAGNDIIMVGWNYNVQKQAVGAVLKAVKEGRISEERLNTSLRRILSYKQKFAPKMNYEPLVIKLKQISFAQIYDQIFDKVFSNQLPDPSVLGRKVEIYSYSWKFLSSYKKWANGRLLYLPKFKGWKNKKNVDTIVFHLSGPTSAKVLRTAPASIKKKIVVINSSSRDYIENDDQFKKVVNVHSYHPSLGSFAAKHLAKTEYRQPTSSTTLSP